MASSCAALGGAERLPSEIIARIVELLSGHHPKTWERGPDICAPLKLSKRELGNCSVVCKYWARALRRGVFLRLVLKSAEDGRQFQSFIQSPASLGLSIAGLVERVELRYDLSGPSWVHLVFLTLWNHALQPGVHITVFDSSTGEGSSYASPTFPRSLFHSIPRPLPLRITIKCALPLQGVRFADFASFHRFLASIRICLRLGTAQAKLRLSGVYIENSDTISIPPPRRSPTVRHLAITDGNTPLRLVCSIASTRLTSNATIQHHMVARLEKVLFAVMKTCPVVQEWTSPAQDDNNHHRPEAEEDHEHPRSFVSSLVGRSFKIFSWCRLTFPVSQISVELQENGTISSLCLVVKNCAPARSFPWGPVGQDLWELIPDVEMLVINIRDARGREALMQVISRRMAQFVQAGRLKFDVSKFRDPILVAAVSAGGDESKGVETEWGGGGEEDDSKEHGKADADRGEGSGDDERGNEETYAKDGCF